MISLLGGGDDEHLERERWDEEQRINGDRSINLRDYSKDFFILG